MKLLSSFALSLLALSACATEGDFADRASEVEGIYRVDSHLLNDASCSPGGTPFQDSQKFAFAKRANAFGHEFLNLMSCASLEDCRAKAAQKELTGTFAFGFSLTGVDGDALTGLEASTGFSEPGGRCTMPELSNIVLTLEGNALRLEKATHIGTDYQTSNGVCTTDKGREASEGAPCSQMETLTATLVEAL